MWSAFGFAALIGLYLLGVFILFGQVRGGMIVGLIAVVTFLVVGFWSLVTRTITRPAAVFIFTMMICAAGAASINGGADGYVAPLLIVPTIAAGFFLGMRSTFVFGLLSIVCVVALYIADVGGLVMESPFEPEAIRFAAAFLLCIAITLVLVASTISARQMSLSGMDVQQKQSMLTSMSKAANVGAWEWDLQNGTIIWSDQMRSIHDVEADYVPTMEQVAEFIPKEVQPELNVEVQKCIKYGEPFDLEIPVITAKGRHIWVRTVGHRVLQNGAPYKLFGAFQDITVQQQERASLAEALEKADQALADLSAYQSALDRMMIVAMTDINGTITFANNRFCEVSGYDREELLGQDHRILNSGTHSKDFFEDMWRTIRCGKPWQGEICNRAKDGRLYWVDSMIIPICDLAGHPKKFVSIRYDITDRVANAEELETRRREAEAANEAKSQFLANMSHEIRTPLNGVLGMAQLLERSPLNEKQKRFTQTIQSSGKALLALINDILDISKIEAGLMHLDEDIFDLDEILQEVVDSVLGIAQQKGLTIRAERVFDGTSLFFGDGNRIRQVLINLTGNAVKFTDEGCIDIKADRTGDGAIRIDVTDCGPGIAPDQQRAIFERFVQADGSVTRKHGGTGLGLAISYDLVTLMQGQIGVESAMGEGATFWIALPLKTAEQQLDTAIDELKSVADRNGGTSGQDNVPITRVLVAEDNPVNQEVVRQALSACVDHNFECHMVENGAEAIEALDREPFDIVLMDINMPVMNGEEATRKIRTSNKAYADVPIIVITANALTGQSSRYLRAGASSYLSKPLDLAELTTVMSELLDNDDQKKSVVA